MGTSLQYHKERAKLLKERELSFDMDDFVEIEGFENYSINSRGTVINTVRMKEVKPFFCFRKGHKQGNYRVRLRKDKKDYKFTRSHLVYRAFVGEWDSNLVIDHIDSNPLNDHYTNLQAITQSENIKRAIRKN